MHGQNMQNSSSEYISIETGDVVFSEKYMKVGLVVESKLYDIKNKFCWVLINGQVECINSMHLWKLDDKIAREIDEAIRHCEV